MVTGSDERILLIDNFLLYLTNYAIADMSVYI